MLEYGEFWGKNHGLEGKIPGSRKFQTLDSRPKLRTQWLCPECQMGRANISNEIVNCHQTIRDILGV